MNRKVNTFFIGQPRCGTTSLYHYLKGSPNIYLPEQKQLYHFEKDYNEFRKNNGMSKSKIKNYYNYSLEDYLKHFKDVENEKVIAEITPSYLYSKVAASEIHHYNQDAKLIAIFRNPISYVVSIHKLLHLNKIEFISDVIDAVKASKRREKSHYKQSKSEKKEITNYYERVKYSDQLSKYLKLFPKENIKILFYEDFKNNNQVFLNEICEFLLIDKVLIKETVKKNYSRQTKIEFVMYLLNSKAVNFISFLLPKKVRTYLGRIIRKISTSKSEDIIPFAHRQFLFNEFKEEIEDFGQLLVNNGYINSTNELIEKWKFNKD
jgi:hypothetical protein